MPPGSKTDWFYALLSLLVWLPLPLGSNRPWPKRYSRSGCGAVLAVALWVSAQPRDGRGGFQRGAHGVVVAGGWLVYVMLQMIPLPALVRQVLSPEKSGHVPAGR